MYVITVVECKIKKKVIKNILLLCIGALVSGTSKQFDKHCYSKHNLGLNIKSKKRVNQSQRSLFNVSELSDIDGLNMLSDNCKYDKFLFTTHL